MVSERALSLAGLCHGWGAGRHPSRLKPSSHQHPNDSLWPLSRTLSVTARTSAVLKVFVLFNDQDPALHQEVAGYHDVLIARTFEDARHANGLTLEVHAPSVGIGRALVVHGRDGLELEARLIELRETLERENYDGLVAFFHFEALGRLGLSKQ